jgi:hypothetical protein
MHRGGLNRRVAHRSSQLDLYFRSTWLKPFCLETSGQQVDAMVVQYERFPVHFQSRTWRTKSWPDLLTRWAVRSAQRLARPRVALIMIAPVSGADEPGQDDWPSRVSVVEEQRNFLSNRPYGQRCDADLLVDEGQRWWVPDAAVELKLRILIAAHAGPAGHRDCRHDFWCFVIFCCPMCARRSTISYKAVLFVCLRKPRGYDAHLDTACMRMR